MTDHPLRPRPAPRSLTAEPVHPPGLTPVLARNIAALQARREQDDADLSWQDRLAEVITRFSGSMPFVWAHAAIVVFWTAANLGVLPGVPVFDKSFVILATVASVEGIFLSTFVLISQNRAMAAANRRADLDLQTNLLAEHEVTRLVTLTQAIARKLELPEAEALDLPEIARDVAPETVLDGIEEAEREATSR